METTHLQVDTERYYTSKCAAIEGFQATKCSRDEMQDSSYP